MGKPPAGAMSTPYGHNNSERDSFIADATKALENTGSSTGWGQYGDAPAKYTNLPKSEADALIAKERAEAAVIAEKARIDALVAEKLAKETITAPTVPVEQTDAFKKAQEEINRLKMELEIERRVNERLTQLK
jgi:hypothetical protein